MCLASSRAHLEGLRQVDSSSVVFKQLAEHSGCSIRNVHTFLLHLLEEVHHDNGDADTFRQPNVFTVGGGGHHFGLKLGGPNDWTAYNALC